MRSLLPEEGREDRLHKGRDGEQVCLSDNKQVVFRVESGELRVDIQINPFTHFGAGLFPRVGKNVEADKYAFPRHNGIEVGFKRRIALSFTESSPNVPQVSVDRLNLPGRAAIKANRNGNNCRSDVRGGILDFSALRTMRGSKDQPTVAHGARSGIESVAFFAVLPSEGGDGIRDLAQCGGVVGHRRLSQGDDFE